MKLQPWNQVQELMVMLDATEMWLQGSRMLTFEGIVLDGEHVDGQKLEDACLADGQWRICQETVKIHQHLPRTLRQVPHTNQNWKNNWHPWKYL